MARTKQTARMSSGGNVKQFSSKSSSSFRNYLLSQQNVGKLGNSAARPTTTTDTTTRKKIFINCENIFGSFAFKRSQTSEFFEPKISLARCISSLLSDKADNSGIDDKLFMRVDFCSNLDGKLVTGSPQRPPLDLIFVVDESGSMGDGFPDDSDRRSKLSVAIDGMHKICSELTPADSVGIVGFNTHSKVHLPLTQVNDEFMNRTLGKVTLAMVASGGTNLSLGLLAGYDALEIPTRQSTIQSGRQRRVIFLTDMQSTDQDEQEVLAAARLKADPSNGAAFVTVVGVGVDLSALTVDAISAITGARYVSATSAAEFLTTVATDFNYDVTPIAFQIAMTLPLSLSFERVYGSAELNALPRGSRVATVSTEFPVPLDASHSTHGGLYLCQLREEGHAGEDVDNMLTVTWQDPSGEPHSLRIPLLLPARLQPSSSSSSSGGRLSWQCDSGLRKGLVLAEYVSFLTDYAHTAESSMKSADVPASPALEKLLLSGPEAFLEHPEALPAGTPPALAVAIKTAREASRLRALLVSELASVGDESLMGVNGGLLRTLDQVLLLETQTVRDGVQALRDALPAIAQEGEEEVPRGLQCPLSLCVLRDPVTAADGHTYERALLQQWMDDSQARGAPLLSPLTNLPLAHPNLVPNHALKMLLQEHHQRKSGSGAAVAATDTVKSPASRPASRPAFPRITRSATRTRTSPRRKTNKP